MSNTELLSMTLEAGVLIEIAELKKRGGPEDWQLERLRTDHAWYLAEHGDDLLYGGKHSAEAMKKLIEALAVGAFQPCGVTFAGLHFEAGAKEQREDESL